MKTMLITGGTGYIGSHTICALIEKGYEIVIIDNLCNSNIEVLDRIKTISGVKPTFYEGDVRDEQLVRSVFSKHNFIGVIHFAGLKAVGESVEKPDLYYDNNIGSTKVLLKVMEEFGVYRIIFSSTATVYGNPKRVPLFETDPIGETTNPYAESKYQVELLLNDFAKKHENCSIAILRYFNPIGAHESGLIGEDPLGIPNNLLPFITQVAIGKRAMLSVFGNDYDTKDGTCERDYIHILDLAEGHVLALSKLEKEYGIFTYNIGTNKGTSVLEFIHDFESVNNLTIPYKVVERRAGDVASCYANCDKAKEELGFVAKHSVAKGCADSWNWQKNNPNGYRK